MIDAPKMKFLIRIRNSPAPVDSNRTIPRSPGPDWKQRDTLHCFRSMKSHKFQACVTKPTQHREVRGVEAAPKWLMRCISGNASATLATQCDDTKKRPQTSGPQRKVLQSENGVSAVAASHFFQ